MESGHESINIRNFTINDNEKSHAPKSMNMGWFYIRVTEKINSTELANLGITFNTTDMIQRGWYKKFLNKTQVDNIRNTKKFSLFPVKNYQIPDFQKLKGISKLRVTATDDWNPNPPAKIRKVGYGIFIAEGQTAEKLFEDPYVCMVDEVPITIPI